MTFRQLALNGIVVFVAVVVGVVLCEVGARLVLNPADYLSVTTRADDVLGMTIAPNSPGFDEWGFRNSKVPAAVEIVTVGDSHTFGNTASMNEAWPSVLSRSTGKSVYNLGLGGYGPNQYYHLLATRALTLHPKWVLCGLYMGDDFENAFSITYGLNHWAPLRAGDWGNPDPNIWDDAEPPGALKALRNWLSRESMTYRLVVHGGVLSAFKEGWRFREVGRSDDPAVTSLIIENRKIREAFRPAGIAKRLDQSSREVREGMRITFHLLQAMNGLCDKNGCQFVVVIIPTKETVFADELLRDPSLHLRDSVEQIVSSELNARKELGEFLDREGILYVDTLPALRLAIGEELYARTTADMHPGRNGYRVIADSVTEFLDRSR